MSEDKRNMAENTTSLTDDLTRVLNHADTFGVFNRWGDILPGSQQLHGVYFLGMRHLSTYRMLFNGKRPVLLNSALEATHESMDVHLINPESGTTPRGGIHLHRRLKLANGFFEEETAIQNYSSGPAEFTLEFQVEADFRDLFEVRGFRRDERGRHLDGHQDQGFLETKYLGKDNVIRCSNVKIRPETACLEEGKFLIKVRLKAGESKNLNIKMIFICEEKSWERRSKLKLREFDFTGIRSDNEVFNRWLTRSKTDLYALVAPTSHGYYPYAGIPWFNTAFGRDGLISAYFTLWLVPELTRDVLKLLAATQATEIDRTNDAEPGKILHEMRTGEMANTGEVPFKKYYGSIDATPLFVFIAGQYFRRTADEETLEEIFPAIEAALRWMERFGDRDDDGYLEYHKVSENGLYNQGWKDADDAIFHASGEIAESPLAVCEIQAYAYAAYKEAAWLYNKRGNADEANEYRSKARKLKTSFNKDFWDEEMECFVLALDKNKQPCRVKSSNSAQVPAFGIADKHKLEAHVQSIFSADMHTGWGIRTLSEKASKFNPISYHNGSVWPHDNAIIAYGLALNDRKAEANSLFASMFALCEWYDDRRLPELFCGFQRNSDEGPVHYPVACSPQAWAVTSIYHFLRGAFGMDFDAHRKRFTFCRPSLPPFLKRVVIEGLKLGEGQVDFTVAGEGRKTEVMIERNTSDWKVVVEK